MKKEDVFIRVQQKIHYVDSKGKETFQHSGQGTLIELQTYSKLSYKEEDGTLTEVKWPASQDRIEISRQGNKMYLIPNQIVEYPYQMGGSQTILQIETQGIKVTESTLDARYTLKMEGQVFGRYHYRINYRSRSSY